MLASSKEFLDTQATIECGFTLKYLHDMTRTYSQMHCTDKYLQHSSIIWPVWLNSWVFVYELGSTWQTVENRRQSWFGMVCSSSLVAQRYFIELRTKKCIKVYGILLFARNLSNNYGKQVFNTAAKAGLDALKIASKKVVHKAAGEFIGSKIAGKILKLKPVSDDDLKDAEEKIIPPEKREKILKEFRLVLWKCSIIKCLNY